MRRLLRGVPGAMLALLGLWVAVVAAQGVPNMPVTSAAGLFGWPELDGLLAVRLRGVRAALITATGVLVCGAGAHLARLGLLRRVPLPRPSDWPTGWPALAFGSTSFALLLTAFLVEDLAAAPDNQVQAGFGVLATTIGASFPLLVSLYRVRTPQVRLTELDGEQGIRIARSPRYAVILAVLSLACGLIAAVATVGLLRWLSGEPSVTVDTRYGPVLLWLGAGMWLGALAGLFALLMTLVTRDRLVLTPTRVVVDVEGSTADVPWDAVCGALAVNERSRLLIHLVVLPDQHITGRLNRLNEHVAEQKFVTVPFQGFGIDPITLYHLYLYYWAYPQARAELGTGVAIDRIVAGDLVSPVAATFLMADPVSESDVSLPAFGNRDWKFSTE